MPLNEEERRFVRRRRKWVHSWPVAGSLLLVLFLCFCAWLFWKQPLLINPYAVLSQLDAGSIPLHMLWLMAALMPVAMLMCLVLVVVMILFGFASFSREKRLLDIIERVSDGASFL